MKSFHCCATCVHFVAMKLDGDMAYKCSRLGYETKPSYQFSCWSPKELVKKLIEKEENK